MLNARSFNDFATVSDKENDYRIQFWYISKNEAINVLGNYDLYEKSKTLQTIKMYYHIIQWLKKIITFGNTNIENDTFHQ